MPSMNRALLLAAALLVLPGCASLESHLADTAHPWHAWPEVGASYVCALPGLPVAWLGSTLTGQEGTHNAWYGALCGLPGAVGGTIVGGAFLVVGSPLELVVLSTPEDGDGEEEPETPRAGQEPAPASSPSR